MSLSSEMLWFQRACQGYACVPLVLGSTVALTGCAGLETIFGMEAALTRDPTLESSVRFLAANFAAMGVVCMWGSYDVVARRGVLRIFFGAAVAGGALRVASILLHGMPTPMTLFVIGGEFSAAVLWLWHERILAKLLAKKE